MKILLVDLFFFIVSLILWVIGYLKMHSWLWPLRIHKRYQIQRRVLLGACFWSFFMVSIALFLAIILLNILNLQMEINKLIRSPGILYALIALFFTVYAFLNTLIIQQRQRQEIGSFSQLLDELCEKFREWDNMNDEEKKKKFFFIVDYTPAIGSISEPKQYCRFANRLLNITRSSVQTKVVCYPKDLIAHFHKQLRVSPSQTIREGRTIQQEVDWIINDLEGERGNEQVPDAVWRINRIGPLHLIVTPDVVYQFVVIPEFNGTKNKVIGFRSEDTFVIEFFKQTYSDYESEAVTPSCQRKSTSEIELTFRTQQEGVKTIEVYISKSDKVNVSEGNTPLTCTWNKPCIKNDQLIKDAKFLKVVLVKENNARSVPSKLVEIFS